MNPSVQRFFNSGVLIVWSLVLVYFYCSGQLVNYLHPNFYIYTLLSGIALFLMAIALFFTGGEHSCCEHDPGHHHDHDEADSHEQKNHHEEPRWVPMIIKTVLLLVPLLVSVVISPAQFGASTALNRGFVSNIADLPGYEQAVEPVLPGEETSQNDTEGQTEPQDTGLPKNKEGAILAQTIDLLYAAQEPAMREDFQDKEVEVVGQFMPAKANNASGDRFNLLRMYVICCAADARPVAMMVKSTKPFQIPEMSWVKVVGKATFPIEGGQAIPLVEAKSIEICDPPAETFIYN